MKKRSSTIAAVVDLGSNALKMRIAQRAKGEIQELEQLEYPLNVGHEVFSTGRISFDGLREISRILSGFSQVMSEYGVGQVRVVGTTALRECQNRDYVIDQLSVQNNLSLEILEETQEKSLIYSELMRRLRDRDVTDFESTLISFVGTGSIGIAACSRGNIVFTQNIRIGSVKLHDILGSVESLTDKFYVVVEEYLDTLLSDTKEYVEKKGIKELILSGSEFDSVARCLNISPVDGVYDITNKEIEALYEQVRVFSTEKLCEKYGVSEAEGEELYAVLAIYSRLLKMTGSKQVHYVKVDVWDALIRSMLLPDRKGGEQALIDNTMASVERIAKKYQCDRAHYSFVRDAAQELFDKTRKYHGLGGKYRLLLSLAAVLHDCGHYVSTKNHLSASYGLIKSVEIFGLTGGEQNIIAHVARYNESCTPDFTDPDFRALSEKQRLIVSKLVAIFRLAGALDKSHRQKLETLKIRLEGQKLMVTGITDRDTDLELWAFYRCAGFFEDVFGIKPTFEIKTKLL